MSKGTFRSILSLIAFAAIMVLLLTRLDIFITVVQNIFKVLTPFLVGFVLAYVLNIPYMFFMT
ncbi:MAG: AI-2E family transporter, partial [Clostridia bacterium]|nr:AI-2E family transporter [Clostridia bacterium]